MDVGRVCAWCQEPIPTTMRADARYCSAPHRARDWKRRQRQARAQPVDWQAVAWQLERQSPERWGLRARGGGSVLDVLDDEDDELTATPDSFSRLLTRELHPSRF